MTVDEELVLLDDTLRRLKIEYDVYFGGGSKKPPAETEWRVTSLLKKYSDSGKLTFSQRFKYNSIAQKYALFADLWRKKLRIKEEGYRRPQDAILGIQGLRTAEEHQAEEELESGTLPAATGGDEFAPFRIACSDADSEHHHVQALYDAMLTARQKSGGASGGSASFDSFKAFVKKKTEQIRKDYGCQQVEYSVEMENGQVRLKAKPKI